MTRITAGLALLALLLTGCAGINSYTATADVDGRQYSICNKRGALLEVTEPDGTHIKADDRGHPEQPGFFQQIMGLMILQKTD